MVCRGREARGRVLLWRRVHLGNSGLDLRLALEHPVGLSHTSDSGTTLVGKIGGLPFLDLRNE
jgi:hypothetical protein